METQTKTILTMVVIVAITATMIMSIAVSDQVFAKKGYKGVHVHQSISQESHTHQTSFGGSNTATTTQTNTGSNTANIVQ